ncbi:glyoxalase [bacterium C-53]|nr:glyoxalase [Lachnospiraceae bacterium]NBI03978.1 glyoxalase [Lachnospiraceae bacterium]RKJ08915.1 glyoxalase [bacterium C-53]
MHEYDEDVLMAFLKDQGKLFDEDVAQTPAEAEAFLEDCMAIVVDSIEEVRDYLEENGMDISNMELSDLEEASEVFKVPGGRYLIVEG